MGRYSIYHQIQTLDPEKDHQQIVYLVGCYEFPHTVKKALEFAMLKTFCVPSISQLLAQTGHFAAHGQKRYDDTALLIAEIGEHGYDSERGRAAIRRMNQLHHRYNISNDDFLYVLSVFTFEPMHWNAKIGWRKSTPIERQAQFRFWQEIGQRMNIQNIPPTYEAFEQFSRDYEQRCFAYSEANHQIAEASMQVYLAMFPAFVRPLLRPFIYAAMEDHMLAAMGYPAPAQWRRRLVALGMRGYALITRFSPPRRTPYHFTKLPTKTHPNGYRIEDLGPQEE